MKLVTVRFDGEVVHGAVEGQEVVIHGSGDLSGVIASGGLVAAGGRRVPVDDVEVLAPLSAPPTVLAVAANYQEHVTETGGEERDKARTSPRLFIKPATTIAGTGGSVAVPSFTDELDWEAELGVVIGTGGRDIAREAALDHVFGYVTANDISVRSMDLGYQRDDDAATGFFDWLEGKWIDGSAPIGPYLVTRDEVPDPHGLELSLTVNGEVKQHGSTGNMIHRVDELIAFASSIMTLTPGDVILTGTPSGVGAATGTFLRPGDVMVAEVAGLGALTTHVTNM